jgi:hypothetical protein
VASATVPDPRDPWWRGIGPWPGVPRRKSRWRPLWSHRGENKTTSDVAAGTQTRRDADRQYRQQLGLAPNQPMPSRLGTGAPAGGVGVYRGRDRKAASRQRGRGWVGKYTPDVKVNNEQIRSSKCPRCLAKVGDPCRDQRGRAHSRGHAERIELARRDEVRRLRRRDGPDDGQDATGSSSVRRRAQPQPSTARVDPASGKQVISAAEAVGWSLGRKRVLRTDDGGATTRGRQAPQPGQGVAPGGGRNPDALARPCRRCGALIGRPCRGTDGTTRAVPHPRRGQAASSR